MKLDSMRPAWIEINLNNLIYNLNAIRELLPDTTKIMAVVKANAYNHDSVIISKELISNGVGALAVSILSEGIRLRRAGIDVPILLLNYTDRSEFVSAIENDLTLTIYNFDEVSALNEVAKRLGKLAHIHIKLDTGMSRLGYLCEDESVEEIVKIGDLSNVRIDGIYTHFAKSDYADKSTTENQLERFNGMLEKIERRGVKIPARHVSNSAAIIDMPNCNMEFVRPGIILYGYLPSEEVNGDRLALKPLMSLHAKVSNIKVLPEGVGISYGHSFVTQRETVLATIPLGYSDGYSRLLSDKASVYINGKLAPSRGKICMDQFMVDVTDIDDVKIGDEVVLFGYDRPEYPNLSDLAEMMGSIHYELMCMMSLRIPRVYIKDGEVVDIICDPEA